MAKVSLSPELSELHRKFKQGYRLEETGGGHFRVRDRQDELVQFRGKNLTLTKSPSPKVVNILREQLLEAGVLSGTKMRVTQKTKDLRLVGLRAVQEERARQHSAEAEAMHERLSVALRSVGGLDFPGISGDLSVVGALIAREQGKPLTPDLLMGSAHRVAKGQYITEPYQEIWIELASRLEHSADPTGAWFNMIREARGLPVDRVEVRPVGDDEWPFRVELLSLETLLTDKSYQRPPNWRFVRATAAKFDPSLVGTIDVAQRSPSRYAILDGQQRSEIVRLLGMETIWASVYQGLDIASEARFFLKKNRDRRAVHPFYTFQAKVTSRDPVAMAVDRIVQEHGYAIALGGPGSKLGTGKDNVIQAVHALETAYNRKRPDEDADALTPTLRVMRGSTLGRPHGQAASLLRGLSLVFSKYSEAELDEDRLTQSVAYSGPDLIIGRARDLQRTAGGTVDIAVAKVVIGEYDRRGSGTLKKAKLAA